MMNVPTRAIVYSPSTSTSLSYHVMGSHSSTRSRSKVYHFISKEFTYFTSLARQGWSLRFCIVYTTIYKNTPERKQVKACVCQENEGKGTCNIGDAGQKLYMKTEHHGAGLFEMFRAPIRVNGWGYLFFCVDENKISNRVSLHRCSSSCKDMWSFIVILYALFVHGERRINGYIYTTIK